MSYDDPKYAPRQQSASHPLLSQMYDQVDQWKSEGDARQFFLSCYATMTGNMIRAIDHGEFSDSTWVMRLLERFAEYYFEAQHLVGTGAASRPLIWEYTHRATRTCDMHVMQSILMGVNAHINYDLVLTLHELLKEDWPIMSDELKALRHADHLKVNEIIARTIDTVQDDIIEPESPVMDIIDRVMGRVDEYLLSRLIRHWRKNVWDAATQMLDAETPEQIEQQRLQLEQHARAMARHLLLR